MEDSFGPARKVHGYIPRDAAVECGATIPKWWDGINPPAEQGAIWYDAEVSHRIHRHPRFIAAEDWADDNAREEKG